MYSLLITHYSFFAISLNLHNELASCICCVDLQSGSNNEGLATKINIALALETATLNLFKLYKNSIPRGASSGVEVAIEKMITGASCPWNLSTVPMSNIQNTFQFFNLGIIRRNDLNVIRAQFVFLFIAIYPINIAAEKTVNN